MYMTIYIYICICKCIVSKCSFKFISLVGTCKINMKCTADLKVNTIRDGKVHVEACDTHHGHEMELKHIPLSKQGCQEIASKTKQGVPADKILDDICQSMPDNLQTPHLDKKEINNIQQAYGLKDIQHHPNNQQSVLAWIEEWESSPETNPVLFYKMQGEEIYD